MTVDHVLQFGEIRRRLKAISRDLPPVELVVGIATGGVVPAGLLAYELDKPLAIIHVNYRADDNSPQHPAPLLLSTADLPKEARHVLLVDDVAVSGQTIELARRSLADRNVVTLVLKGDADFSLFPELDGCVAWPWNSS
ncbi:MAG TPA: phosphoribosyltransferase family protein [Acidimicrobiia bacterium]|nr:phosphoribosyltransferase family protein [Acidimicrobiia bacterium]